MSDGDISDGSDFDDYENPYSIVGPPSGQCPCHTCAEDLSRLISDDTAPSPDKDPIQSTKYKNSSKSARCIGKLLRAINCILI